MSGPRLALLAIASLALGLPVNTLAAPTPVQTLSQSRADDVRRAIDEKRLLDAARMIDQARIDGVKDPRVALLTGELGLASGRYDFALKDFKAAEEQGFRAESLQGQGLALVGMRRVDDATPLLERAVQEDPKAWRAWNALGTLHDRKREWPAAEDAYARALATTDQPGIVLNNRGYSRLLQSQYDRALADFVAALQARPDLAEARTNLRLALALKGEYARALAGTRPEEKAALLNNAGFAASMRGDYARARDLLQEAIEARGVYFEKADSNLKFVNEIAARGKAPQ